jgi:hypothetical protein
MRRMGKTKKPMKTQSLEKLREDAELGWVIGTI